MARPGRAAPEAGIKCGQRAHARLHVRLQAWAVTLTETRPAILRDLSLHGAQIETDAVLRIGSEIVLQWKGVEAFGEVVWVEGHVCGIHFAEAISPAALIATRDLDDAEHLPHDRDLLRDQARRWAWGLQRL